MRIPPNERRLKRIRIRRGSESQRKQVVFEEGEPVLDKTRKRVFIGDSKRYGGNLASNINYIQGNKNLPPKSEVFDIYYYPDDESLNIVNGDNLTHREIIPSLTKCCVNTLHDIERLEALMLQMEVTCNTPCKLDTDKDINLTTDDGRWINVKGSKLCNDNPNNLSWAINLQNTLTVNVGNTFTLTTSAIGTTPITYSWNKVGSGVLVGKTSNTLTFNSVTKTDSGIYICNALNPNGYITSNALSLNVI